eukprot:TRINITY_DN2182_c0_g1_i1.p1 TRINITY_DN2182_c0_g1~~TRINITY_DN2182_c0_g1_i1.p1  ORF type:complete len:335 (-),score=110.91 TRINITY_DN2182_c0_g1_i1:136-1083(-)
MPPKGKKRAATKSAAAPSSKKKAWDEEILDGISAAESGGLKVISFNVNGLRACLNWDRLLVKYVEAEKPDILLIQETKMDKSIASDMGMIIPGYKAHFNCCTTRKGYAGTVAFVNKETTKPIKVTKGIGEKEGDAEGRAITIELENIFVVGTYTPNSGRGLPRLDYRVDTWDKRMKDYLKELEERKPVLWCGDLNVAHKEIDIKNPKTNKKSAGFTIQERESFSDILEAGFTDMWREQHPEDVEYSWWSYMRGARGKNIGWRLDYTVVSDSLKDHVDETFIRGSVLGSDHCPVGIVFKPDFKVEVEVEDEDEPEE